MSPIIQADHLEWQSSLSLEDVFSAGESFAYPEFYRDGLLYLTQLKDENSRSVLVFKDSVFNENRAIQRITPDGFNLRSKISEYGGKPYWLHGRDLYFANQHDQCLYRQHLPEVDCLTEQGVSLPKRASVKPSTKAQHMYSDVAPLSDRVLVAIVEQENPSDHSQENLSYIACLDPESPDQAPKQLIHGADFYSNLVVDEQRQKLAWVQWQHPGMPWDDTRLMIADYAIKANAVELTKVQEVDLGAPASICQVQFANNGALFFSADFSATSRTKLPAEFQQYADYWSLFRYTPDQQTLDAVSKLALEFGSPHWQYGDAKLAQHTPTKLIAIGSGVDGDQLFEVDQDSLEMCSLEIVTAETQSITMQNLVSDGQGHVAVIRSGKTENPRLAVIDTRALTETVVLQNAVKLEAISCAEHIKFNTRDGLNAYGFYYAPTNAHYYANTAPPLIVLVHGGPTARAVGSFDLQKQFWTSRGFALFDVNHRGSTGYGRAYRDALYGEWGEIDASDIIDGIEFLVEQGKADAQRVCIRGKSAGGYAVLRALTQYPDVFKAGACYYGIGNLATLAQATHKFEKHYTDRLINERYDPQTAQQTSSQFYQRSPIHKMAAVESAMIIFQGGQDKVVPPELALEVVKVLESAKLEHQYVEYSDEGHGFRQVQNNIDAWTKELAFYQRVLSN